MREEAADRRNMRCEADASRARAAEIRAISKECDEAGSRGEDGMTDRSDEQRLGDLEREIQRIGDLEHEVERLNGEIQGIHGFLKKQEEWHREQLAAANLERNELRDVIREMRSKPPEERAATTSDLTDEERDLARSGKMIDAIKSVRFRMHVDLRTAKAIVDGFNRSGT